MSDHHPTLPPWVPAPSEPKSERYRLHHRWDYREPTACGLRNVGSTVSVYSVQCRACLAALGVDVDDRTPEQKGGDLARALWQMWT